MLYSRLLNDRLIASSIKNDVHFVEESNIIYFRSWTLFQLMKRLNEENAWKDQWHDENISQNASIKYLCHLWIEFKILTMIMKEKWIWYAVESKDLCHAHWKFVSDEKMKMFALFQFMIK